jgi:hypothetical protein
MDQVLRARGSSLEAFFARSVSAYSREVAELRANCKSTSVSAQDTIYYVANTREPDAFLALRDNPSNNGMLIAKLRNGTQLRILERRSDGWWRIQVISTDEIGWASRGNGAVDWIVCCSSAALSERPAYMPLDHYIPRQYEAEVQSRRRAQQQAEVDRINAQRSAKDRADSLLERLQRLAPLADSAAIRSFTQD